MPRFIAVHTFPWNEQETVENYRTLAKSPLPPGVAWNQSWCDFDNHKFFCEWEAASKEVLEAGFQQYKVPFDEIHEVRRYDIAAAELEPVRRIVTV